MIDPKQRAKLKGLEAFISANILGQLEAVREMVPILINGGVRGMRACKGRYRGFVVDSRITNVHSSCCLEHVR